MRLRKGDVVKKRRGGGRKLCEVVHVTKTHATLRPLTATKKGSVTSLVVRRGEDGLPEGYEVAS